MEVNAKVWVRDARSVWVQGRITNITVRSARIALTSKFSPGSGFGSLTLVSSVLLLQLNTKSESSIAVSLEGSSETRQIALPKSTAAAGSAGKPSALMEFDEIKLCNLIPHGHTELQAALGMHDLSQLMQLHEASILDAVHLRFTVDCIYTCTGRILLAVNPFKEVPLYSDEILSMYARVFVMVGACSTVTCCTQVPNGDGNRHPPDSEGRWLGSRDEE